MHRIHPWDRQNHCIFALLLCLALGLFVGGFWVTPLFIPGGLFLAGALSMCSNAYTRMFRWPEHDLHGNIVEQPNDEESQTPENVVLAPAPNITVNMLNQFNIYRQRSRSLELERGYRLPLPRSASAPPPRTLGLV